MIRRAVQADIPTLVELEQVFPSDRMDRRSFRHLLQSGNGSVLVYTSNGVTVGDAVVLYRSNSRVARIYSLVVQPAHRGRGIAQQLLQAVEADARAHHSYSLRLEVRPDNAQAQRLYTRAGYVQECRLERFYEDGSPALRFCKTL